MTRLVWVLPAEKQGWFEEENCSSKNNLKKRVAKQTDVRKVSRLVWSEKVERRAKFKQEIIWKKII